MLSSPASLKRFGKIKRNAKYHEYRAMSSTFPLEFAVNAVQTFRRLSILASIFLKRKIFSFNSTFSRIFPDCAHILPIQI